MASKLYREPFPGMTLEQTRDALAEKAKERPHISGHASVYVTEVLRTPFVGEEFFSLQYDDGDEGLPESIERKCIEEIERKARSISVATSADIPHCPPNASADTRQWYAQRYLW